MHILRVSFFLFIFLFHSFAFSEALEERAKTVETIFINFITDLLSKGDIPNANEQLNRFVESSWLDDIITATKEWTVDEIKNFLNTLQESGIQSRSILSILQAIDYIKVLKSEFHFTFSGEDRPASQRQNAGRVFLDFVQVNLETSEIENRMGSDWRVEIFHHTRYWPMTDAQRFLEVLANSDISLDSILRLLQAPDYLEKLRTGQISFNFLQRSNVLAEETVLSQTEPSTEPQNTITGQNAGDIFIQRAKEYFREEFEEEKNKKYKNMTYEEAFQKRMGSEWEDKIKKATKSWTREDAIALLGYLSHRIGKTAALNRIKRTSYFRDMLSYRRFIERVEFYEGYIGEEEVTKRLNRSLGGFHRGDIKEIKKVIKFLEEYLGSREIVQNIMLKSLAGFSQLSGRANAQTNLNNIKDVIAYLRSIGITEKRIKSIIFENFEGFVQATRRRLEIRRQLLMQEETIGLVFTSDEINKMIERNIRGFLQADLQKVKEMVTYLRSIGFEDETIKDMAIRNLKGLAFAPETLRSKKELLMQAETIGIAFTSDEINKMIAESIQGFLQANLHKVKEMVTYLQSIGFKDETIKEMAIRNLWGLSADPETLRSKRALLMQEETIGMAFTSDEINKMIERSIQSFLQADLQKVKEMVVYLRNKDTGLGFKDEIIKDMAIRNLIGLSADPETLRSKRELLMQEETIGIAFTSDEINKMIAESIQSFLQADLQKAKEMVAYLRSIGFEDETIKDMAIRNLQGLAADPEILRRKRASLTKAETIGITFDLDEINKMIVENIEDFLGVDLQKVKKMVAYLRNKDTGLGFKDDTIKAMAISNLKGLAADPETLRSKRALLMQEETIGIAFDLDEINKMIAKSIEGFLGVDLQKVKKMVAYLRNKDTGLGFKDDTIKAMAIKNLQGLAADPEILRRKRASLTKAETLGITFAPDEIDRMIVESIQGFLRADLEKVRKMVAYLRNKDTGLGFKDETVKDMAIRNLQGLAADPETLRNKKELLMQEETIGIAFASDEINQVIEKDIGGFLVADLQKVKQMVKYLKDIGFKDVQIKNMAIRSFIIFSTIKSYDLRNMIDLFKREQHLRQVEEKTLMKKIREMMITQGLKNFFYHNFDVNLKTLICIHALSK